MAKFAGFNSNPDTFCGCVYVFGQVGTTLGFNTTNEMIRIIKSLRLEKTCKIIKSNL